MCVYIFTESSILGANRLLDTHRGVVCKVLRSDRERLKKELAVAGESSQETILEKYTSLVCERREVRGYLAHCKSTDSFTLQFSDAIGKLERLEEEAKEEARANVQQRRIDRFVVPVGYLSPAEPIDSP